MCSKKGWTRVSNPVHWADFTARRVLKERGQKEEYVVASGLTPSGVVHFGNFREVITADFVARALCDLGHSVRFILSWDDYDTFRKIPADLLESADNPEDLQKFLFRPIVDTLDPYGEYPCYAARFQKQFEGELARVGVELEPIYQAQRYRAGAYAKQLLEVIEKRHSIREVLNQARREPHGNPTCRSTSIAKNATPTTVLKKRNGGTGNWFIIACTAVTAGGKTHAQVRA